MGSIGLGMGPNLDVGHQSLWPWRPHAGCRTLRSLRDKEKPPAGISPVSWFRGRGNNPLEVAYAAASKEPEPLPEITDQDVHLICWTAIVPNSS
jgi:hypothetical protein